MIERPPKTFDVTINITQPIKVNVLKTITQTIVERVWWLILIYVLVCIIGAYATSFFDLGPIKSFWISMSFSLIETVIGYFAIMKVVRITKEVESHS
ncbi:MAG TPA: hypothetical protein VFA53_11880 [Xanthobacteraceae bacterium]|nr:hypothetical protein [Xanthobacteraceae bacterium]